MNNVERIEQEIKALSQEELAELRAWLLEFDWAAWEQQLDRDVRQGKLDQLANEALQQQTDGHTQPI